jgi:hypothetical protein
MATSLLLTACEHRLAARVPVSESGEPAPTSVAFRMDESAEVLLSLPRGATTSEIAFLRTWAGADRTFEVLVNVDEWNAYDGTWSLKDCEDHACLPSDTQVGSRAGDGVLRLLVRGGRFCVQGPRPRRSLSVELVQGAASIDARFEFTTVRW